MKKLYLKAAVTFSVRFYNSIKMFPFYELDLNIFNRICYKKIDNNNIELQKN